MALRRGLRTHYQSMISAGRLRLPYFPRLNQAGTIVAMRERSLRSNRLPLIAIALIALSGCDPIVNIAGANFPAWLLCAIGGAILAALLRPALVATGVEAYLWPVTVVYSSLAFVLACLLYLTFFNRI
jgi:hypothetical protein